jgi:hypothetical protein
MLEPNMGVSETEQAGFRAMVETHFAFLKSEAGLVLTGVDSVDEGPRDSYVIAKYRSGARRVDIAWAPVEMSLSILLHIEMDSLSRREQSLYAEPFIEFVTHGKIMPVVPQIYPAMSVSSIQKAMDARAKVFAEGLAGVAEALAKRVKAYYPEIQDASLDTVRAYHRWHGGRGADR